MRDKSGVIFDPQFEGGSALKNKKCGGGGAVHCRVQIPSSWLSEIDRNLTIDDATPYCHSLPNWK